MSSFPSKSSLIVAAGLISLVWAPVRAQEAAPDSPEKLIESRGLSPLKSRFVLADGETELRRLYEKAQAAHERAFGTGSARRDILDVESAQASQAREIVRLEEELNELKSMTLGFPLPRRQNSLQKSVTRQLRAKELELQTARTAAKSIRVQRANKKEKRDASVEADQARQEAEIEVQALAEAYGKLQAEYKTLQDDPQLRKAVADLGRAKKVAYQLEPSENFAKVGRWLKANVGQPTEGLMSTAPSSKSESRIALGDELRRAKEVLNSIGFVRGQYHKRREATRRTVLRFVQQAIEDSSKGQSAAISIAKALEANVDYGPGDMSGPNRSKVAEVDALLKAAQERLAAASPTPDKAEATKR